MRTVIDALQASLSSHFQAAVSLRAVSRNRGSIVFRADVATHPALRLAVKCCRQPRSNDPDGRLASLQYRALERVGAAFALEGSRYAVPRPEFLEPALGAVVMSWTDGKSLTRRMARPFSAVHISEDFRRAGAWLGRFHALGPLRDGRFHVGERDANIAAMLAHPLADSRFADGVRVLAATAPRVANEAVQISWLHGDCKSDNILLDQEWTWGIDISLAHENSVEHDLAQFLNHLDLQLLDARYLHLAASQGELERAFMRGYATTGPATSAVCLGWVRLWALLNLWSSSLHMSAGSGIRRWLLNRSFARVCTRLCSTLDGRASSPITAVQ